jgi:hypothetical protein
MHPSRLRPARHTRLREALRDLLTETGGAFAYLDKGTMARRVHRVLLGAAVHAVPAANRDAAS